jgi:aryl-alcohol dehydrogenase-like predicted oxidoreductase
MKKIELTAGSYSSVLGFGCAPILGSIDKKKATYALDFALEQGICHFDLARSYGYGEAERFLGEFLKESKKEVVIASKFGITASMMSIVLKHLKPIVRIMKKANSGKKTSPVTSEENRISKLLLNRVSPLRATHMRESLEKSLKELNKDYLDFFFIHEPLETLFHIEELLETAEKLKNEGKIKSLGLAYRHDQYDLHKSYLKNFDILQFNSPERLEDYTTLVENKGKEKNIIYSLMKGINTQIHPNKKLQMHLNDFPNSVLLISMFNVNHIKQNIEIANSLKTKII